jgi:hypothetical protein
LILLHCSWFIQATYIHFGFFNILLTLYYDLNLLAACLSLKLVYVLHAVINLYLSYHYMWPLFFITWPYHLHDNSSDLLYDTFILLFIMITH